MESNGPHDATVRLSGSDTTFILDEPIEPQHTLKIAVFDEASSRGFDFEQMSEAIADAVTVLPQMQWRAQSVPLGLGRPCGSPILSSMCATTSGTATCLRPAPKTQLCHKIGELASNPVPPGRPPLELWLLEGYEGSKVVALLKMNHALADGGRFVELLDLLTHPGPGAPTLAPAIPTHPRR